MRQQRRPDMHQPHLRRRRTRRRRAREFLGLRHRIQPLIANLGLRARLQAIRRSRTQLHTFRQHDRRITHVRLRQASRFKRRLLWHFHVHAKPCRRTRRMRFRSTLIDGENGSSLHIHSKPTALLNSLNHLFVPRKRPGCAHESASTEDVNGSLSWVQPRHDVGSVKNGCCRHFARSRTRLAYLLGIFAARYAFPTTGCVVAFSRRGHPTALPGCSIVPRSRGVTHARHHAVVITCANGSIDYDRHLPEHLETESCRLALRRHQIEHRHGPGKNMSKAGSLAVTAATPTTELTGQRLVWSTRDAKSVIVHWVPAFGLPTRPAGRLKLRSFGNVTGWR